MAPTIPKYYINLHIHKYYHMCPWAGFKNDWNTNMTLFIENFHTFLLRDRLINIDVRSKWCKPETRLCIWFKSKLAWALFFGWGGPQILILLKELWTWGLSISPKQLPIKNKSLLTTVDPKVKQGSSLGVLYLTYQKCHFAFSAPFAFSMYENAVVRDGFTRKNRCSFGFCPMEGGLCPNFLAPFISTFLVNKKSLLPPKCQ